MALRRTLFLALQPGDDGPAWSKLTDVLLISVMVGSLASIIIHSTGSHNWFTEPFLFVCIATFAIEFVLRVWTAPEGFPLRTDYLRSVFGLIDTLVMIPLGVAVVFAVRGTEVEIARLLPAVVVLKLARYSRSLQALAKVIVRHKRELWAIFLVESAVLFLASTAMFYLERAAQPEVFGSIPRAFWWGVVTLTTVGYGDAAPVTVAGKFLAGIVAMFGVAMFALPAGVLGVAFSRELRREDHELERQK